MFAYSRRHLIQHAVLGTCGLGFSAWAADDAKPPAQLPEFQGIQTWLNSKPLTLADLKDKVVAVHLWTFSCINCQRTLPFMVDLHRKYTDQGLKVVSVHTPEFPFERDINNIKAALKKHDIRYPVAVDNNYRTWRAYNNSYWPHLYLADRKGRIRYDHIGEGAYAKNEQMVRTLLAEG